MYDPIWYLQWLLEVRCIINMLDAYHVSALKRIVGLFPGLSSFSLRFRSPLYTRLKATEPLTFSSGTKISQTIVVTSSNHIDERYLV